MMRSSVDFPQPDGPEQADELPGLDLQVDVSDGDESPFAVP